MLPPKKKINRVVLAYPNQRWLKNDIASTWNLPPNTLCMLAAMLRDQVEIKIVDANFHNLTKEQFQEELRKFKPELVGLSLLTSEYAQVLDYGVDYVKEVDKEIITIVGGVHVTTQSKMVMENSNVDYAVQGEGEYVLRDFIDYLKGDGEFVEKGLIYRDGEKTIFLQPDLVQDLDALPLPAYDMVDYLAYANKLSRYGVDSIHEYPFGRIVSSRGCPVGCSFCQVESISGKKLRLRSAENVVDELIWLKETYGIKGFIFEDDNPFGNKKRTREMLRLMKEKELNLIWKSAGVAIFMLDDEILKLMAETGCQAIGVAIESGSPRILKEIINKPVNLEKVPPIVKKAQQYGLFVIANFIIGFPGETWEEIRQTLDYAEKCGVDYVKIYGAQPLLGTRLYEEAKALGAISGDHNEVGWRNCRIETDQFTSKEISMLRVYEWDRINFTDINKRKKTAKMMNATLEELDLIRAETRKVLNL